MHSNYFSLQLILALGKFIEAQFFVMACLVPIPEGRELETSPVGKILQVIGGSVFRG